mgnify:CR=1 FL=1
MQFVIFKDLLSSKHLPKSNILQRNFSKFDKEKFSKDLGKIEFQKLLNECHSDINLCFDKFYKITNNIADKHAPFRQVTKKEQSLQLKPWITKEIRHLIWERDKLFSKYCRAKDIRKKFELHEKFKRYRNEIVFKIRNSKKIYFQSFFEKNKNDSKKIWKGIRSLVTLKKKNLTQPTSLSVNGELLTNPIKVSNVFNKYFVNIGPNLSNEISNDAPDFH